MEKLFKRSMLSMAVVGVIAGASMATAPTAQAEGFFEDSSISGGINFWFRDRTRGDFDADTGQDTPKKTNLDHGSVMMNLGFASGYVGDVAGLDLNVYSTFDLYNHGSPDHEMNFWNVNNPYDMQPDTDTGCGGTWDASCTDNGVSVQTAAAKFKFGDNVTAKAGWFQPSVPGAIGVNWSYAAGTYTGGEIGFNHDNLQLGFVYATEYKAPWFKDSYEFREADGKTDAGDAFSVGGRYTFDNGLLIDAAYAGLTDGDRKNAHVKVKYTTEGGLYLSPQLYVVDDDGQFDSTAFQLAFLSAKSFGAYNVRAEATYTVAEDKDASVIGNMSYRLTKAYGGSNGTYDIWWNNRSDFNHDGEFAAFASVARDFTDLGAPGFSAGISGAFGMASPDVAGVDDLFEYAGSVFANYAIQNGALKGANFGMYYTEYVNDTDAGNWAPYTNLFQDESDIKVTLTIPFTIK